MDDVNGCDVCGSDDHQTGGCQLLKDGVQVGDTKCPSRALLTVPANLRVKTVATSSSSKITIQARENVSINTRFGPLEARPIVTPTTDSVPEFPLKVFNDDGSWHLLDTTDKSHCNWMCLVQPAQSHAEHNLNALQLSDGIYFLAKRNIRIHEELRVWYAPHYGRKIGFHGPPWPTPDESGVGVDAAAAVAPSAKRKRRSHLLSMAIEAMDSPNSELPRRTLRKRSAKVWKEYVKDVQEDDDYEAGGIRSQQSDKLDALQESPAAEIEATKKPKSYECLICSRKFTSAKFLENHELRFHKDEQMVLNFEMLPDETMGGGEARADPVPSIEIEDDGEDCEQVSVIIMDDASGEANRAVLRLLQDGDNLYVPSSEADDPNVIGAEIIASGQILMEAMRNAEVMEVEASHLDPDIRQESGSVHDELPDLEPIQFDCPKCGKSFVDEASMSTHACVTEGPLVSNRQKVSRTRVACRYCKKIFNSNCFLKRHVAERTSGRHKCSECGKNHCSNKTLWSHVCPGPSSNSAGPFSCKICHKSFTRMKYLDKHMPIHTGSHTCDICGKWLRSRDSLQNHKRICGQVKELQNTGTAQCPQCKQMFTDVREFRRHFYEHTHLFPCGKCGARFRNKGLLDCHLCRPVSPTACDVCGENFANSADLETHRRTNHETLDPAVGSPVKEEAGKIEESQEKATKDPISTNQNLQPFVCKLCSSLFSSKSSLNVHMRLHGEKQYECGVCGKRFHRKDMLADHCAKHGEASIPCPICQKRFKTKKSLDIHKLLHDGRKRFSCQTCGKEFYQRGNLTKHEEVHKDKPRQKCSCPSCPKQFSTKEYLAIHILEHKNGRKFTCDECGKGFVKEHQLKAHERMLHTNLTYICKFCGRNVKLKHSLKRHLIQKHPDQKDLWSSAECISEMLMSSDAAQSTAATSRGPRAKSLPIPSPSNLPTTANDSSSQGGDGEVLLAVTGIESKALQRALASGSACIRPGTAPNTIEISLPMEDPAIQEFITGERHESIGEVDGDGSVDCVQMMAYMESPETAEVTHHPYELDEGQDDNVIALEDAQAELLDEPPTVANDMTTASLGKMATLGVSRQPVKLLLTRESTIILEGGTLIQQGTSEDGSNVLFYVLAPGPNTEKDADDLKAE